MQHPMPEGTREALCKGCGARILWVRTIAGKQMPIDPEPHDDGNVAIVPAGAMVIAKDMVEKGKAIGARRYLSHFATCPKANNFRTQKGPANA